MFHTSDHILIESSLTKVAIQILHCLASLYTAQHLAKVVFVNGSIACTVTRHNVVNNRESAAVPFDEKNDGKKAIFEVTIEPSRRSKSRKVFE
jgi:hypothetical protein